MLTTTLNLCREHGACDSGYTKLARSLGGVRKYGADTPITLTHILKSNGFADAIWALRAVPVEQSGERDKLARLFACECAEHTLELFESKFPDDKRPRQAIEVARLYANGGATIDELTTARAAAYAAYAGAAYAAYAAGAAYAGAAYAAYAAYAAGAYAGAAAAAADAADGRQRERDWQAVLLLSMLEEEVPIDETTPATP